MGAREQKKEREQAKGARSRESSAGGGTPRTCVAESDASRVAESACGDSRRCAERVVADPASQGDGVTGANLGATPELTFSPWMSARSYDELHPPRSRQSITEADLLAGYGVAPTPAAIASACVLGAIAGLAIGVVLMPRGFFAVVALIGGVA